MVRVSNFVLPAYFNGDNNGPWDFRSQLPGPLPAMRPGGYLSYWENNRWKQITARLADSQVYGAKFMAASRPQPGSRRHRRTVGAYDRIASTAHTEAP